MSQPSIDRKSELLVIARRSRIKWIRSADDPASENWSRKQKFYPAADKLDPVFPTASPKKENSHDAFQRAFDLLTNIIADGETIDVGSLISTDSMTDDDFNSNEVKDDVGIKSPPTISLDEYTYPQYLLYLCSRCNVATVKTMQQFVSNFESKIRTRATSLDEKVNQVEMSRGADSIWAFIDRITTETAESLKIFWPENNSPWRALTRIYCEKFIFGKIYSATFHSSYEDYFLNQKLSERILSLSFLKPEHLDINAFNAIRSCDHTDSKTRVPPGNGSIEAKWWVEYIDEAVSSLQQLRYASCPHDKISCIKRMSCAVERSLQSTKSEGDSTISDTTGARIMIPIGADDVLPLLILCVKESNPPHLHSELKYLQTYLDPSQSCGEAGYLVTQLASAVNFLETVDATALTISSDEFNRSLRRVQASTVPLRSAVEGSEKSTAPKGLGISTSEFEAGTSAAAMQSTSRDRPHVTDCSVGVTPTRHMYGADQPDSKRAPSALMELYRSRSQRKSAVHRIEMSFS